MKILQDTEFRRFLFGDGSDGSIIYDPVDARWEDGNGVPLVTVADKWTVSGATMQLHRNFVFQTVDGGLGGILVFGGDDKPEHIVVKARGLFRMAGLGRAGILRVPADEARLGGLVRTTAGAGNSGLRPASIGSSLLNGGFTGGHGGGDGTNVGGPARFRSNGDASGFRPTPFSSTSTIFSGGGNTTGAGGNGPNGVVSSYVPDVLMGPFFPGGTGGVAGGGALKQSGGSNRGGAGGDGGRGGGIVRIYAREIAIESTGIIHADGENGTAGQSGIATNAAGDISGGGGGGAGGGGGMVCIGYESLANNGIIRAAGGLGGTGGAGQEFNGVARPTSNGGNGGNGAAGVVILEKLI